MAIQNSSRFLVTGVSSALLLLAACGSGPDLDTMRSAVVAEAAGNRLTGADIERWLMASPIPSGLETVSTLTSTWIDETLLAQAIHDSLALTGSGTVDSMLTTEFTMARLLDYYRERSLKYPPITDAQADSLFDSGNVRVFQRVMLRILPEGDQRAREGAENRLTQIRTRVEGGGEDFTALVKTLSESPDAQSGGYSTLTGDQVQGNQINGHLWTLRPGDFSRIYSSEVLAVLFRRADKVASRDSLKGWLAPVLARRADGAFIDSLVKASNLVIARDASRRIRLMALEPGKAEGDTPLATWTGGQADPAKVARWLWALDPSARFAMQDASEDQAAAFLKNLAERDLLLGVAGGGLRDSIQVVLQRGFREAIDNLTTEVTSAGPAKGDYATRLLDSLTVGNRPFTPVPTGLAVWLRNRYPVTVDQKLLRELTQAIGYQYAEKAANQPDSN